MEKLKWLGYKPIVDWAGASLTLIHFSRTNKYFVVADSERIVKM